MSRVALLGVLCGLAGCLVTDGQIGRDDPERLDAQAPPPPADAAPPTEAPDPDPDAGPAPGPCAGCLETTGDDLLACLLAGEPVEPCVEPTRACAARCGALGPCEECGFALELAAAACAGSCGEALVELEAACAAACAPADCAPCAQEALATLGACLIADAPGCLPAALESLERCGPECSGPSCPACLAETAAHAEICAAPGCGEVVAIEIGACTSACLPEPCEACDAAVGLTEGLCLDAGGEECAASSDPVFAGCLAICEGDDCALCQAEADQALLTCQRLGEPGCVERHQASLDACIGRCEAPAFDHCQRCFMIAEVAAATCPPEPACHHLGEQLFEACGQVCASGAACADCMLPRVEDAADCVGEMPAEICAAAFTVEACAPVCHGPSCADCVAAADLEFGACTQAGGPQPCDDLLLEALARCECGALPACGARIAAAAALCVELLPPDACPAILEAIELACLGG